ncbi:AAA family ATPase [Gaoshiqia sp. Z1-71]|uniref:AAA family ATPase n=1 Tax=Gaoshiqia hydrogeniformans TaxID=3290090 RepID=UPI003BF874FA
MNHHIQNSGDDWFFGREQEIDFLLKSMAGFERSGTSFLLVEGPAGIGKTSLIKQVLGNYQKKKCFKLYGKYSNQPEQVPYQGIKQAAKDWANQILVLSEEELNELKNNTYSALQHNVTVVTSVFEELELFFGRKKLAAGSAVKTETNQIKSKFYYFFTKFLRSVAHSGYQLIFFLDDLQWADNASWDLIEELVNRQLVPDLMIIGAYRPSEGRSDLQSKINNIKKRQTQQTLIFTVKPLGIDHFKRFVPENWQFGEQDTAAFCKYLWHESEGNPFKMKEIVKAIEKGQLVKNKLANEPSFWENLPRFGLSKSSGDLIHERLELLPSGYKQIIAVASCIGYYFKADLLSQLLNFPSEKIEQVLLKLTDDDLLIKKGTTYLFVHDTVFSAAHDLLPARQKSGLHHQIGHLLLSGMNDYRQNDLFQAVNHLNAGWEAEKTKPENTAQLFLNIQAARLAIKKSAFERAWEYYQFADQLLKHQQLPEMGISDPKLAEVFEKQVFNKPGLEYLVLFGFAETMFLMQKFDQALFYANKVLQLKINRHQKILATLIKVRICSALISKKEVQDILLGGLQSLESVLNDFEIVFPDHPDELFKQVSDDSFEISRMALGLNENTDFNALINPDQEYQDLIELVINAMTFVYYMDVRKNLFMGIKFLLMSFTKGFTPMTPVLFSLSFLSASVSQAHLSMAYLLGKISLRMIEKQPFSSYTHIIYYIATLNFFVWENHYKTGVLKLKESVLLAKEAGDHHFASFCATNIMLLNTYRGKNLKKHQRYSKKLENQNQLVFFISSIDSDLSAYLTGIKPGFAENEGEFVFSEDLVRESEYNLSGRYHLHLALQKLYYLSGHYTKALEAGAVCENLKNIYRGFQIELEHYLFYSLSLLHSVSEKNGLLDDVLAKVNPKLDEFRRLSTFGSGNYLHKVLLIEAEIARCKGEFEKATHLYDQAIQEAKKQKFTHHAAIAAELAAEYYFSKDRQLPGRFYLKEALKLYSKWGADAKVAWMTQRYPFLGKDKTAAEKPGLPDYQSVRNIIHRTALSHDLKLNELGKLLLSDLTEQSQAQGGAVLSLQKSGWQVLSTNKPEWDHLENKPLSNVAGELPAKVLNYAVNKAEKIMLTNVRQMAHFADDPYFVRNVPENIFCYPVFSGLGIEGLIYLENIKPAAIEKDGLFSLMAEHASIALANAMYNENLYRLNQEIQSQEQKKIEAIIESQEKERKRVAEELHDSVGQMLALVKMNLSRVETGNEQAGPGNTELIRQTSVLLDESINEVRAISHDLMPPDLKGKSLTEIIENLLIKHGNANGLAFKLQTFGISDELPEAVKFTLYRITQEIIHNIVKHANAQKMTLNMTRNDEGINLMVEDDGMGFDPGMVSSGLGLKNIHSRVKLLNGYFDVDSSLNRGTIYNVTIPLTN